MLETGQLVTTADGHSGRIVTAVSHATADAYASIDENHVVVRSVLLSSGEIRWYADTALTPLAWGKSGEIDGNTHR